MKCDNCTNAAVYTVADPGANPINFCSNCLPSWLRDRAAAGHFPLAKAEKTTTKKKAEAEEAPADENN